MNNREISKILNQVAAAYTVLGENRFKIIAYERASEIIGKSNVEVKELWQEGKLDSLPGIGKAMMSHMDELFKSGKVKHFDSIFKKLPSGMFTLIEIPGFGPQKAYKLAKIFKLNNANTAVKILLGAAKSGKIADLDGFGAKSQRDIIEALEAYTKGQTKEVRMPLPYAYAIAEKIINYLRECKDVSEAFPLGSLRRFVSTIGDIDIAVSTDNTNAVLDWFLKYPKKSAIIEKGPRGATIQLESGSKIDLRVQKPQSFGSMLQYFTGSKQHNIRLRELALKKGLSLNEYGIKLLNKSVKRLATSEQNFNKENKIYEYAQEENLYNALGLNWIAPELREDRGEIEAAHRRYAVAGKPSVNAQDKSSGLPNLVDLNDIKGDLHVHSNYNIEPSHDLGASSVEELLKRASELGYEYLGISDHNPSTGNHTPGRIISIMKARKSNFAHFLSSIKSVRTHLFTMMEIDILKDGKLAIPEEAFEYLDAGIVSIHSGFNMNKENMTKRILQGLSHPKAKIFAHPSGRLLGKRVGYDVNWDELFKYCGSNNKALEINSFPERLDLADDLVREAIKKSVRLVINTDSHDKSHMSLMKYGVYVARRGWAQKDDILNCLSYNSMSKWLSC